MLRGIAARRVERWLRKRAGELYSKIERLAQVFGQQGHVAREPKRRAVAAEPALHVLRVSVLPVCWTSRVYTDEALAVEAKLAKAAGVGAVELREYLAETVEETLWRGRPRSERKTGFRFVRGTHSGHYVRDPEGTDPLPFGLEPPPENAAVGRR